MAHFLTADWRWLLMLNYRVEPGLVERLVPAGCELDLVDGETFISVVGFLFENTRLKGVPVPFHQRFEEVNLRYYHRRRTDDGEVRRAVGFVKEIVPRWAIAAVARVVYHEAYVSLPMRHRVDLRDGALVEGARVSYGWETTRWHEVGATIAGPAAPLREGSHEQFIAEHYWGYAAQRDGGTVEYQVEHPPWRVFPVRDARLDADVTETWGAQFAGTLAGAPVSAFVAEGSGISVSDGVRLNT